MKSNTIVFLIISFLLSSCASIPRETILLSQTLGHDLETLNHAHKNIIEIHFNNIENDINTFIDDVYSPYVIHYVLSSELKNYKVGNDNLFSTIELAGKVGGKKETDDAISVMQDFQEAAREQIESKRSELLNPIKKQKAEVLNTVDASYNNAIYANSTITAYLQSIKKIKDTQGQVLSGIGLNKADSLITESLVKLSELVNNAVKDGKRIDTKSDDAFKQIEKITKQLKQLTNTD